VGDTIIIFNSKYDGELNDIESDDPANKGFARICRSLDELLVLCPAAGVEYGKDIPEYTEKWFEDNAVILLAFNDGGTTPHISVGDISVDGSTAHVELFRIYKAYNYYPAKYTILIEAETKHLAGVETVAPPIVIAREEE